MPSKLVQDPNTDVLLFSLSAASVKSFPIPLPGLIVHGIDKTMSHETDQ